MTDPLLQPISDAMDRGRLDQALAEALRIVGDPATPRTTRVHAHRLAGLVCFHVGDHATAVPHLLAAAEGLDDRPAWFVLALGRTQAGDIDGARQAFERALQRPAEGAAAEMSEAHMRFDWMTNLVDARAFEVALEQLDLLRRTYAGLPSTEPTVLNARRVPLLAHTLDIASFLFQRIGPGFDAQGWLRAFAAELDEGGRRLVESHLGRAGV